MAKDIKQEITEFLKANPNCSKKNVYRNWKVVNYECNIDQNIHELTIVPSFYKLEKFGNLHPDLKKCLQEKKSIVYFWTEKELKQSDPFVFEGVDDGYYWTIFPEEEIIEQLATYDYHNDHSFTNYLEQKGYKVSDDTDKVDLEKEYKNYLQAQIWLDFNYPENGVCQRETHDLGGDNNEGWNNKGKKRKEITKLNIHKEQLEGSLDLRDFVNLEYLWCDDNNLDGLDVSGLTQLREIYCSTNKLTSDKLRIDGLNNLEKFSGLRNHLSDLHLLLLSLNPEKLTNLRIGDNNFTRKDLVIFSRFTKLKELWIGGDNKSYFTQNIYNKFFGSLEPLKNLTYLEELHIDNTDVNSGVEFISPSIKKIFHSTQERPESKVKEITQELDDYLTQKWLEKHYPKEKRKNVTEITNMYSQGLRGHLDLNDFVNLEKLNCRNNEFTSLGISKNTKLKELNCYKNQLTNLDTSNNSQLVKLVCSENQLTDLKLCKNNQLIELYCFNNLLTDLDLSSLDPKKLLRLNISSNNFPEQNLSFFSKFTNLEHLQVGTYDKERIEKNIYNRFSGSLEYLKNLNKLEELDISNTDINCGVESLPNSITEIYYSTERTGNKLEEIAEELKWWENIGHGFIPKIKKEWKDKGLDYEETKEWVESGLKPEDADYARWLRDIKKKNAEWVSNYGDDELRKEYKNKEKKNQEFQEQIQVDPYQK